MAGKLMTAFDFTAAESEQVGTAGPSTMLRFGRDDKVGCCASVGMT